MKRYLLLLFFCALVSCAGAQGSYWEKMRGPDGGEPIEMVEVSNGRVYALFYDSTVYCSDDKAMHWYQIFAPSPDLTSGMQQISVGRGGTLFSAKPNPLGGPGKTIFKSEDNGTSWQVLLPATEGVQVIAQTSDSVLFALQWTISSLGRNIVRSLDGGSTWQKVYETPIASRIEVDQYDHVIVGGSSSFYYSLNKGNSWGQAPLELNEANYGFVNGYLFYLTSAGLYRWNLATQSGEAISLSLDPSPKLMTFPSGKIWVCVPRHVYQSEDNGQTWTEIPLGFFPTGLPLRGPLSDSTVLVNGTNGIYRSETQGQSWQFSGYNMDKTEARSFFALSPTEWVAMTGAGLWETADGGQNWLLKKQTVQDVNWGWWSESLVKDSGDVFYVRMRDSLFRYQRASGLFKNVTPEWGTPTPVYWNGIGVNPVTHTAFASTPLGVARSADSGNTWQIVLDTFRLNKMEVHPSGAIYALMDSIYHVPYPNKRKSYLFVSKDDGLHWTVTSPASANSSFTIAPDGAIYANFDSRLYRSTDGGATWAKRDGFFYGENFVANANDQLFATYNTQGILIGIDEGTRWQMLPRAMLKISTVYAQIALDPQSHLYANIHEYGYTGASGSLYRTRRPTTEGAYLTGRVQVDADADCTTPDAQPAPSRSWSVKAEGENTWYGSTDSSGRYKMFIDTGTYQVTTAVPQKIWWTLCDSIQSVEMNQMLATDTADFTSVALSDCPLMFVDVMAPRLRRCFENPIFVQYCNQGPEPADSAWVEIEIDPYLTLTSAELPYDSLDPKKFRFNLGPVQPGVCGQFYFNVLVDCDSTILGQTHCILAHAWPDTLCVPVNGWSGANIEAEAHCLGDTMVQLTLRNTGTGISQMLEYIIIEDLVVLDMGDNVYDVGEELVINMPAKGRTWRIESKQEPGHPFSNLAIAFTEGCDGFNSLGLVNQFNINGIRPAWNRFCLENTGSYDPNDKQGFPLGYGTENRIRPGQDLKYLIRFQNTGTDTAFTVVVRDTLSAWLDPASVRPGAASHPYTWALSGQGVLSFTFSNILLPDSTTNLAASQGFISFHIEQQPNVPLGAKILNEANIYFDFNAPIVTNQTLHTVGLDDLSSTEDLLRDQPTDAVQVSPNPVAESAVFRLREGAFQQHRLTLTDALGRTVWQSQVTGSQYVFDRKNLPAGVYGYRVDDVQRRLVGSGKVVLR